MSCGKVLADGEKALHHCGLSCTQAKAVWAMNRMGRIRVVQTWELLPRCPACRHWVSPRTGVCNYKHCPRRGQQVAPATGWPPAATVILRLKRQVEAVRAELGLNAPARPRNFEEEQAYKEALAKAQAEAASPQPDPATAAAAATAQAEAEAAVQAALEANTKGDYRIPDGENLAPGSEKARFDANIAAIKLLKSIENEDRPATPKEQEILSKYTGWGALPQAFDPYGQWKQRCESLRDLLTEDEFRSARASTPNAHFTSPEVVDAMWEGLRKLGFTGGKVLEPAMGVGNFFGRMPEEMARQSIRAGVEMDSISARIAQKLYPNTHIVESGFENTDYPDNYFDIGISNVPFGDYPVYDRGMQESGRGYLTRSIHDYFFAKTLDKVRPGGVMALVTSRYTLDKVDSSVRDYLDANAHFLGAMRLPSSAFQENAGTEVVTDVIFLQKKDPNAPPDPEIEALDRGWRQVEETPLTRTRRRRKYGTYGSDAEYEEYEETHDLPVNEYYLNHPEQILGRMDASGTMQYGAQVNVVDDGRDLKAAMAEATSRLPKQAYARAANVKRCSICKAFMAADATRCTNPRCPTNRPSASIPIQGLRDGSYVLDGDNIWRKQGADLVDPGRRYSDRRLKIAAGLMGIRDAAKEVLRINAEYGSDAELEVAQKKLNRLYDAFVDAFGPITWQYNRNSLKDDPDLPLLLALEENFDKDAKSADKAGLFSTRVVARSAEVEEADSAMDGLTICLNQYGVIDVDRIAELCDKSKMEVVSDLEGAIFQVPGGDWVLADQYLSGDVVSKLAAAREAASLDPQFEANVDALEAVQPNLLGTEDITVGIGSAWVPTEVVADFAKHLFGQNLTASYDESSARWLLAPGGRYFRKWDARIQIRWGVPDADGLDLLESTLNGSMRTITTSDSEGKRVKDEQATMAARAMQAKIKREWQTWVFSDPDRAKLLTGIYNDKFNRTVTRKWDGARYIGRLPGTSPDMPELRAHQKNAIWRMIQSDGNTLLAHTVGAGKTWAMIGAGMEMRRLGLRNKVMHVVQNSTIEQYVDEFRRMYPTARLLAIDSKDLSPRERKTTMQRIATGEYDAIIVRQTDFSKMPMSHAVEAQFVEEEVQALRNGMESMARQARHSGSKVDRAHRRSIKRMEKKVQRLQARLQRLVDAQEHDDNIVGFDQTGIDQLFVDEVHAFKNLAITGTSRDNVAGISTGGSNRATDFLMKTQYLQRRCDNCGAFMSRDGVCRKCGGIVRSKTGLVGASGTPISNSVVEMYTMMRYFIPDRLKELGIEHFDAWANMFGDTVTALEMRPAGDGYREKTRFAKFNNVPELMKLWLEFSDVAMDRDELGLAAPDLHGGKAAAVSVPASPWLKSFIKTCGYRADHLDPKHPELDNMLKIVGDAHRAATDPRLIDPTLPDEPASKVNACVGNIADIHDATTAMVVDGEADPVNMAQVVFLDTSTPKANQFNLYDDIKAKLIAQGIPEEEIAFIHDARNDAQRAALFDRVNKGEVRVILGTTEKLGTGVNIQRRLYAAHHLDAPWRPADVEQRDGRIQRQGNLNDEVEVFRYATEESFDVYRWQLLEQKARFIGQVTTGDVSGRSMEDIDEVTMGYAEMKALATGNPVLIDQVKTDLRVKKLEDLERQHGEKVRRARADLEMARKKVATLGTSIPKWRAVAAAVGAATGPTEFGGFSGSEDTKATEIGEAFMRALKPYQGTFGKGVIGKYKGFPVVAEGNGPMAAKVSIQLSKDVVVQVDPSDSAVGNARRLANAVDVTSDVKQFEQKLAQAQRDIATFEVEGHRAFPQQAELAQARLELADLNAQVAALQAADASGSMSAVGQDRATDEMVEVAGASVASAVNEALSDVLSAFG